MSCFAGIITGIMSFAHFSAFERFNRSYAAGIMFFISSESHLLEKDIGNSYSYVYHCWQDHSPLSFLCSAGYGHLYWSDSPLPGETLRWLALLLVLHPGLGGHAYDLFCRWKCNKMQITIKTLYCSVQIKIEVHETMNFDQYHLIQCILSVAGIFYICAYRECECRRGNGPR